MPSFSADVKNELAHKLDKKKCCQTAELAALLRMGASITLGSNMMLGLSFVTENAAVQYDPLNLAGHSTLKRQRRKLLKRQLNRRAERQSDHSDFNKK